MTGMFRGDDPAGALRAGLLLLVVLGVVGTAVSLAYERHWTTTWQWAPWITLGVITVATVALIIRQTTVTVWLARAAAALAIVSSVLGVWQHIDVNLDPDHDHSDHAHSAAMSADDEQHDDEGSASDDHHHADDEETASDDHHHADDEGTASDDHHDTDDEATAAHADGADADEEAESSEMSMADVLTGSAGTVPVPAALAIAPVGLALALATIGLGGRRPSSPR